MCPIQAVLFPYLHHHQALTRRETPRHECRGAVKRRGKQRAERGAVRVCQPPHWNSPISPRVWHFSQRSLVKAEPCTNSISASARLDFMFTSLWRSEHGRMGSLNQTQGHNDERWENKAHLQRDRQEEVSLAYMNTHIKVTVYGIGCCTCGKLLYLAFSAFKLNFHKGDFYPC